MAKQITDEKQADFSLLYPLILETAQKALKADPKDMQTGPAMRGDHNIIAMHTRMPQRTADRSATGLSLFSEQILSRHQQCEGRFRTALHQNILNRIRRKISLAKDFSSQQVVDGYDQHIRKLIPGYEVVHQQILALLKAHLPERANILIIGAGTGYELGYLSRSIFQTAPLPSPSFHRCHAG